MQYTIQIQSLLWCHLYHKPKITQCEKTRNSLSPKNISSNQLFSTILFVKRLLSRFFFSKKCEKILQFPHCGSMSLVIGFYLLEFNFVLHQMISSKIPELLSVIFFFPEYLNKIRFRKAIFCNQPF